MNVQVGRVVSLDQVDFGVVRKPAVVREQQRWLVEILNKVDGCPRRRFVVVPQEKLHPLSSREAQLTLDELQREREERREYEHLMLECERPLSPEQTSRLHHLFLKFSLLDRKG